MQKYKQEETFDISKHVSSKILNTPNMLGFHLNLSHNKTQAFTWPKHIKQKIKDETWNEKSLKKLTNSAIGMWFSS